MSEKPEDVLITQLRCIVLDTTDGVKIRFKDMHDLQRPEEIATLDKTVITKHDVEVGDELIWTIAPEYGYEEIIKVTKVMLWKRKSRSTIDWTKLGFND